MLTYVSNSAHYKEVLSRVQSVKHMLWIGTADIKDLYVEIGKEKIDRCDNHSVIGTGDVLVDHFRQQADDGKYAFPERNLADGNEHEQRNHQNIEPPGHHDHCQKIPAQKSSDRKAERPRQIVQYGHVINRIARICRDQVRILSCSVKQILRHVAVHIGRQ